jgi:hypothetical protein
LLASESFLAEELHARWLGVARMEMTMAKALAFLRGHQPLPGDDAVSNAELEELDLIRRFLKDHPNDEALELLLGVFGEGSGFGVYQLIEEAVAAHEHAAVVAALEKRLVGGSRSVRYWCAQIAVNHPDERLIVALSAALALDDDDLRWAAVTALEAIDTQTARNVLRSWLPMERDVELRELIEHACAEP